MADTIVPVMKPLDGEPDIHRGRSQDPELQALLNGGPNGKGLKDFTGQWVMVFEDQPVKSTYGDPLKREGVEIRRKTTCKATDTSPARYTVVMRYTGEKAKAKAEPAKS